jgi:hypothetical protein
MMNDLSNHPSDDLALPVSQRVRARIQRAKQRYHANDNIAAYIWKVW